MQIATEAIGGGLDGALENKLVIELFSGVGEQASEPCDELTIVTPKFNTHRGLKWALMAIQVIVVQIIKNLVFTN
jgi:hypothetical protein